jgi:hypothetical protein
LLRLAGCQFVRCRHAFHGSGASLNHALFPLTTKLNKLTIKVDRPHLSPEDIKELDGAEAEALDGKPLNRSLALTRPAKGVSKGRHADIR